MKQLASPLKGELSPVKPTRVSTMEAWMDTTSGRLLCLVSVRILTACCLPFILPDCDETFNYWEATHFLQYGRGLQTWEYAPQFALRSWFYIGLHALVGHLWHLLFAHKVFRRQ